MKMATALPDAKSRRNGLHDLAGQLTRSPEKPILVVAVVDSSQMMVDHDKHTKTPTVRVLHVEPLLDGGARRIAHSLLTEAYMRRTTEQLDLPFDEFDFPPDGSGMMTSGSGDYHGDDETPDGWGNS